MRTQAIVFAFDTSIPVSISAALFCNSTSSTSNWQPYCPLLYTLMLYPRRGCHNTPSDWTTGACLMWIDHGPRVFIPPRVEAGMRRRRGCFRPCFFHGVCVWEREREMEVAPRVRSPWFVSITGRTGRATVSRPYAMRIGGGSLSLSRRTAGRARARAPTRVWAFLESLSQVRELFLCLCLL